MNYDNWKTQAPPERNEAEAICEICEEQYDQEYSDAEDFNRFCCGKCETKILNEENEL